MINKIDIIGVGKKRLNFPQERKEFCTLEEYTDIAKKTISRYCPKNREEILRNDDAVANIAHAIMLADWQFNGRGSKFGFRKSRARFAIKSYLSRRARNLKNVEFSIDSIMNNETQDTFAATIVDDRETAQENLSREENNKYLLKKLEDFRNRGVLSNRAYNYIQDFYLNDMKVEDMAAKYDVTKQSIYHQMNSSMKTLRRLLNKSDFIEK